MAMNRGEVEHFMSVASICQATDTSLLGKVLVNFRSVLSKEKSLLDSSAVELPQECVDILNEAASTASSAISAYEEKGADIAKANQQMMEIITRTMGKAKATGAESAGRMNAAKNSMEEVKGGVRL